MVKKERKNNKPFVKEKKEFLEEVIDLANHESNYIGEAYQEMDAEHGDSDTTVERNHLSFKTFCNWLKLGYHDDWEKEEKENKSTE